MQRLMLHQVTIRQARPSDYSAMEQLYKKSLSENQSGFVQDLSLHGDIGAIARQCIENGGEMLVAYKNARLVGFGGLKADEHGEVELCKLHIDSVFQGLGYGFQLCKILLERARVLRFKGVHLHVTATQFAALRLYKKLGFEQKNRLNIEFAHNGNHYHFDTVFMHLNLHEASKINLSEAKVGAALANGISRAPRCP